MSQDSAEFSAIFTSTPGASPAAARALMRFVTDWAVLTKPGAWCGAAPAPTRRAPIARRPRPAAEPARHRRSSRTWPTLQSGTYRPGRCRRFEIAKPDQPGKTRPLAILTLADRVVHMTVKLILEPMVEARLGERCFGFRPGRNRYDQLQAVRRLVVAIPSSTARPSPPTSPPASTSSIIGSILETSGAGRRPASDRALPVDAGPGRQRPAGWWRRRPVGVLQGSPLSPVIANWNLARFDPAWRQLHGERAPLFRYADDLIILARDDGRGRPAPPAAGALPAPGQPARAGRRQDARRRTSTRALPLLGLLLRRHDDPFSDRQEVRVFVDPRSVPRRVRRGRSWVEQLDPDRPLGRPVQAVQPAAARLVRIYQYAYDAAQAFESLDATCSRPCGGGSSTA